MFGCLKKTLRGDTAHPQPNIPDFTASRPGTQITPIVILRMFSPTRAGVAELADARDSKSRDLHWSCGFDPHLQHQIHTLCQTQNVYVSLTSGSGVAANTASASASVNSCVLFE